MQPRRMECGKAVVRISSRLTVSAWGGGFRKGCTSPHRSIGEAGDPNGHQRRRRHEAQGCGMGKIKNIVGQAAAAHRAIPLVWHALPWRRRRTWFTNVELSSPLFGRVFDSTKPEGLNGEPPPGGGNRVPNRYHLITRVMEEESLGDNLADTSLKVRRFAGQGGVHKFPGTSLPTYFYFAFLYR